MEERARGGVCCRECLRFRRLDGVDLELLSSRCVVLMGSSGKGVMGICLGYRMKVVVCCNQFLVVEGIRCSLSSTPQSRRLIPPPEGGKGR